MAVVVASVSTKSSPEAPVKVVRTLSFSTVPGAGPLPAGARPVVHSGVD